MGNPNQSIVQLNALFCWLWRNLRLLVTSVRDVSIKATAATPSSAQLAFQQQTDEIDFILSHFVESVCQEFKPCSSNKSVYYHLLTREVL